jgi:predicted O-methyltransferase YrrM
LSNFEYPKVLEIGVFKGQSAIPLIHNLSNGFETFLYVGVDILIRDGVSEIFSQFLNISLSSLDESSGRDVFLFENNSLEWLENLKGLDNNEKFDLVLIDGDHNYHTVSTELKLVQNLISPSSIIVCDDYDGVWSTQDMFYSDKEEYKEVKKATQPVKCEKQGVKSAVDDFILSNPLWTGIGSKELEPIILYRKDIWKSPSAIEDDSKLMRDMKIKFEYLEKK